MEEFKSCFGDTHPASHLPIGKNAGRCPIEEGGSREVIDVDDLPECESGMDGAKGCHARTHAQFPVGGGRIALFNGKLRSHASDKIRK